MDCNKYKIGDKVLFVFNVGCNKEGIIKEKYPLPKPHYMIVVDETIIRFIDECDVLCHVIDKPTKPDNSNTSARFNEGKIQTRELYPQFLLGIGEVLTKSRVKYDNFNWCKPTKLSTPFESAMRHLMAFQSGEDFDKESKCHHLLHVATNIMFMYYHNTVNKEESDDRFFKTIGESNGEEK